MSVRWHNNSFNEFYLHSCVLLLKQILWACQCCSSPSVGSLSSNRTAQNQHQSGESKLLELLSVLTFSSAFKGWSGQSCRAEELESSGYQLSHFQLLLLVHTNICPIKERGQYTWQTPFPGSAPSSQGLCALLLSHVSVEVE